MQGRRGRSRNTSRHRRRVSRNRPVGDDGDRGDERTTARDSDDPKLLPLRNRREDGRRQHDLPDERRSVVSIGIETVRAQ